jgi:hypothetical protein
VAAVAKDAVTDWAKDASARAKRGSLCRVVRRGRFTAVSRAV